MPWERRLRTSCPEASERERSSAFGASYCKIIVSTIVSRKSCNASKTSCLGIEPIVEQIVMIEGNKIKEV